MKRSQLLANFFAIICWLVIGVFFTCVYFSEYSIPSYMYFETSRIDSVNVSSASPETVANDTRVNNPLSHEYDCQANLSADGENFKSSHQEDQPKHRASMDKVCEEKEVHSSKIEKRHFLLDDKHGVFYCWMHKVASTSFVAFMAKLKGIRIPQKNVYRNIGRFAAKSLKEAMSAANNYPFRLIVVRHPFHRLISAYRDRIWAATKKYSAQAWAHVPKMLRLSRPSLAHSSVASILSYENRTLMTVPTFAEFVEYLIVVAGLKGQREGNSSKEMTKLNISAFDVHWVPYHHHCSICNISYNVIIKLETIERDVDHFINELNSFRKGNISFKRSDPRSVLNNTQKSDHQIEKRQANTNKSASNEFEGGKSGNQRKCLNNKHQECETEDEISDLFLHHLQKSDTGPSCHCFYFSQLSKSQFDNLKKIYDIDLKMFNYDTHEYEKCLRNLR